MPTSRSSSLWALRCLLCRRNRRCRTVVWSILSRRGRRTSLKVCHHVYLRRLTRGWREVPWLHAFTRRFSVPWSILAGAVRGGGLVFQLLSVASANAPRVSASASSAPSAGCSVASAGARVVHGCGRGWAEWNVGICRHVTCSRR